MFFFQGRNLCRRHNFNFIGENLLAKWFPQRNFLSFKFSGKPTEQITYNWFSWNFADPNPPIDEVIEAGVIPRLVEFLQRTQDNILQVFQAQVVNTVGFDLHMTLARETWSFKISLSLVFAFVLCLFLFCFFCFVLQFVLLIISAKFFYIELFFR